MARKQYKRWPGVIFCALVLIGCEEEMLPILPEFPEEIRYLSITHNSSSNTIIANGVNQLKFDVTGYDADNNKISYLNLATLRKVKIEVNGGNEFGYPYIFQTTNSGIYSFTIKDLPSGADKSGTLKISALGDNHYDPVTLPVVFHYVSAGITDFQRTEIQSTLNKNIQEVNKAFTNLMSSKDPNATNPNIQFKLADKDPEGNLLALPGFHEIYSTEKSFGNYINSTIDNLIWNGNFWSPAKYINVWIVKLDDDFSWAYFPQLTPSNGSFPDKTYGVVYNRDHINNPMTLAHEFGHMFNLQHVFEDSCQDPDDCTDTWTYKRKVTDLGGQYLKKTCDGITFLANNYMDYYPSYNNTFSREQSIRIQFAVNNCPYLPTEKNMLNGKITLLPYSTLNMKREKDSPHRVF